VPPIEGKAVVLVPIYGYISQQWIFRFPFAISLPVARIRCYSSGAKQFSQMNGFFHCSRLSFWSSGK